MNIGVVKTITDKKRKRFKMVEEGGEERLNCHEIDWKNDLQGGETEQKGLKSMKIIGWGGVAVVSVQKMMM